LNLDIRKLQRAIVDGLEDVKAQNIVVFNTEHLSPLFERVIIASGTSNRQTKALASSVRDAVKTHGMGVLRTEGEENGEWIIVDCGAAVVHVMQPAIREYYHLEEIWGDKPVKMKLDGGATRLVKAAEPEPVKAPARKATAAKPLTVKAPARKRAAAKAPAEAAAPAKKAPAKKVAAKRPAAKKAVTRTVGVKAAPAKKPAAKTVAAKPAPVRKAAVKTSATKAAATKTAPAKKAPARKAARKA